MNLESYLLLNDVEIGNVLRTATYLRRGQGGTEWSVMGVAASGFTQGSGYESNYGDVYLDNGPFDPSELPCYCETMDPGDGFKDPEYDAAPWYDANRSESNEFLGFIPLVTLLPNAKRRLTQRSQGGGDVGPVIVGPRIIQVRGAIFAGSKAGMGYGERWLSTVLTGGAGGCAGDTLTVLPYCTAIPDEYDGSAALREFVQVGLVDGPTFGAPVEGATTRYQTVDFQLAAGSGYMRKTAQLYSGSLGTSETCEDMDAPVLAASAAVITITAGGSALTNVEVTGSDGAAYTVVDLPANATLVVDSTFDPVRVAVTNVSGTVIGGMNYLEFDGVFGGMRAAAGGTYEICVDPSAASGTSGATLRIEQVDLEL